MLRDYSIYKPIGLLQAILFAGIYFGGIISGLWNDIVGRLMPDAIYYKLVEMELLYTVPLVLLGILFYGGAFRESWYRYKDHFWRSTCMIIITFITLTVFVSAITPHLSATLPENQNMILDSFRRMSRLVFFSVVCIMIPFIEEIVYRHILIGQVSEKIPLWMAAFISILVFALMHCSQWSDLWYYLPGSVVITAIYIGFGNSVSHSYAYHILNNFAGFILAYQ